jgi:hypothetical protein
MDQRSAIELYSNVDRLREHVSTATHAEKVAALRHVRGFVAAKRKARDFAIANVEASLPAVRAKVAEAKRALEQAQEAERTHIAAIDSAKQEFSATAGVLESRAMDHHSAHELAAADAPETAVA